MNISFATCNRNSALNYIRKVLPSRNDIEDTPESIGKILDWVSADIIRVQDPMMYGNKIGILPGNNWDETLQDEIIKEFTVLQGS